MTEHSCCKSVLDNISIKEVGFPISSLKEEAKKEESPLGPGLALEIVGSCPRCANPIWSTRRLFANDEPVIKRSCDCVTIPRSLPMETK